MSNNFTIFTICTENYKDAIDFFLPSWLKLQGLDEIIIYTDFDLVFPSDKVFVKNCISKTDDWLNIVGLKATLLDRFISGFKKTNFAFLDIDCLVVSNFSQVFDLNFDIAVTRLYAPKIHASSGVWFCKASKQVLKFAKEWVDTQNHYLDRKVGIRPHKSSYSQRSFSDIIHREHKKSSYLNVLALDVKLYNYEHNSIDVWISEICKYKPKIVHYKGRRWRNRQCVNKMQKEIDAYKRSI